ncbi:helix-turn-helix domain-containing protein [Neptunitalea lumnitzerae]|uniref:AraC family transcriptional regulator n=1 Tax=Neptunitalea lumnitzerae TaxID=2965509 RepID=A0ABQ5MJE0_9FLAO|nr:AraC family transcriptional regulator [Neptunitalea sp. Y10]GLB49421.1 AraC family transcriptional regulator [Neptunitalea sp. Y10]
MKNIETLDDFYKQRLEKIPETLQKELGHFNVFAFDDLMGCSIKPIPYSRRGYFKISLIEGKNKVHYLDKTIAIKKQALLFANPQVPYNWEQVGKEQRGFSCVFTENFFHHFGNPIQYAPFQATGDPIIELTDQQTEWAKQVFSEMLTEWTSDYKHKYDKMRMLVFDLLYQAEKIQPPKKNSQQHTNGAQKIATQFLELLERQFPIEDVGVLPLRSASDFAEKLSIHVNHLNKALKMVFQKPTSVIIQERILVEAKILLQHTDKDISEIAFALGFKEATHFHNFFKKQTSITPSQFRID